MELDTASPASVTDTPVTESAPAATEAQTEAATTTYTDDQGNDGIADLLSPVVEDAEVEYEGTKYKVPTVLKDAFMRHQDYTQKTMSVADERRQVEALKSHVQEAQQLNRAEITAFAELNALNDQLAAFKDIVWTDLDHSDPQVQHAKGVRDELMRDLQLKQAQLNEHFAVKNQRAQQQAAKEREQVDQAMSKIMKDWGPEKRSQLEAFAVSRGVPAENAKDASAVELDLIRLAMIGAQTETQRMAALKAATAAKTQPASELGQGSGSGTSDPSKMTMEQYRQWRASQKD